MNGESVKDQGLLFPIPTTSESVKEEPGPEDKRGISPISQHLHQIVAQGHIAGIAHFGDLGLKIETFIDRVQAIIKKNLQRTASATETARFVAKLHLRDLYLATACAKESLGFPGNDSSGRPEYSSLAWRTLEKVYGGFIRDLTRFLSREHHVAQDIADSLLADLFMPDRTGNSRIQSYDGRSSLSTWLRVILINRMTNTRRAKSYSQTDLIEANTPEKPAVISIDRIVRAKRYGSYLADAVREAGCKLGSQERLLLLWRYEDGLQLQQIARLLGIHQSNVTRRLERLYRKLREWILQSLTVTHGLSQNVIKECVQDLVEDSEEMLSILDCIGGKNGGGKQMKHISEIIRESLQEEAFLRTHEAEILKYYVDRAAARKKKPGSVSLAKIGSPDSERKGLSLVEQSRS